MANSIPLLEGTDAAGGYLVPDELRETLIKKFNTESAIGQLVPAQLATGKRAKYTEYLGRPTVDVVGEGAAAPVTGAEYGQVTIDIKKFASTVLYTTELLEDAKEDPSVLLGQDVEGAFANAIDAHALGFAAGAAIVGTFNSELGASASTVELGTGADAFAVAVSSAMATIEGNGGRPNGIIAASDVRAHLRDARLAGDQVANPLYTDGFNREPDSLYGLNLAYTANLDALPAGAGKVAAIVGDFSHAKLLIRKDISMSFSDQASVDVGGTLHHLWQQGKVGVRWEMRAGFAAHDLNRQFVVITNAA